MEIPNKSYNISLNFEEIKLPPFQDILILAKNCAQGKIGLTKSFELMVPNGFVTIDVDDEKVETVFVNKNIVSKISEQNVIKILKNNVFPYISEGEMIRVNFKVNISIKDIMIDTP